jgi:hypothetical protein
MEKIGSGRTGTSGNFPLKPVSIYFAEIFGPQVTVVRPA